MAKLVVLLMSHCNGYLRICQQVPKSGHIPRYVKLYFMFCSKSRCYLNWQFELAILMSAWQSRDCVRWRHREIWYNKVFGYISVFEMINQNFGICCRELGSNLRVFAHASAVSALSVCVGSFSFIISAILPRISWKQIALAARWLSTLSNSMQECRNTAKNNKGTVELIKSSWRESLYSL